jgi:hypothetical protein
VTDPVPQEMVRWMWLGPPGKPEIIVIVVDDHDDDELVSRIASEGNVPSEHFGGVWGAGQRDGNWVVGFHLIELGGGLERRWLTDNIHRELLDAVLKVPHYVAVMPSEIAADAKTVEEVVPRFGSCLFVEVDDRSRQVERVLATRRDD